MVAVGATRSAASAQLSPAASTDRLDLREAGGSLADVRDGSGAAKASRVAAAGSTILLSRKHCTITVLIARRGRLVLAVFRHDARDDARAYTCGSARVGGFEGVKTHGRDGLRTRDRKNTVGFSFCLGYEPF